MINFFKFIKSSIGVHLNKNSAAELLQSHIRNYNHCDYAYCTIKKERKIINASLLTKNDDGKYYYNELLYIGENIEDNFVSHSIKREYDLINILSLTKNSDGKYYYTEPLPLDLYHGDIIGNFVSHNKNIKIFICANNQIFDAKDFYVILIASLYVDWKIMFIFEKEPELNDKISFSYDEYTLNTKPRRNFALYPILMNEIVYNCGTFKLITDMDNALDMP